MGLKNDPAKCANCGTVNCQTDHRGRLADAFSKRPYKGTEQKARSFRKPW